MPYVLAAILWLAPQLPGTVAKSYARIVAREARRYHVDPLLVVTIIHVESSWNTRGASPTSDYGLMQVHVSVTTNPHLRGREAALFDPKVGIRYGVRTLAMWRRWHEQSCRQRRPHFSWSHYQWGYRVRNLDWSLKVRGLYHELKAKFRKHEPELVAFEGV